MLLPYVAIGLGVAQSAYCAITGNAIFLNDTTYSTFGRIASAVTAVFLLLLLAYFRRSMKRTDEMIRRHRNHD